MKNFITNSRSDDLKKRLVELISKSEELKFLVGFFYFSGIREFYESLKNKPDIKIKILVGLNVDKTNKGILELADENPKSSNQEKSHNFLRSIENSINSEEFDTKEFYEQAKFFINLIKKGNLIIRKTYKPNHAKLYLFNLEKDQIARNNLFITGSSNLTKAGLITQEEFNVEISDYGFETAEEYFDSLWSEAVKITENEKIKKELIKTIEDKTLIKEVSPFEAFVLVLKSYLDSVEQREISHSLIETLKEKGYTPYQYQLDAVKQSLSIIEKNNGVIIADVVGLGKTIIACAIAKELKKRGLVICPPGLIGDKNKTTGWEKYIEEFGLKANGWEVRSLGDLENVKKFVKNTNDLEIIIIDEAHRFRNQDTKDYELLKNICRGKIVILLTATPFNNRPGDILSLLKLFITPKKSSITLENNLVNKFKHFKGTFDRLGYINKYCNSPSETKRKKALNYYEAMFGDKNIDLDKVQKRSQYISKQIRNIIEPIIIRRNRLDLQKNPFYKKEVSQLSQLEDPKEWYFELSKEQSDFYDKVIDKYFGGPKNNGEFKGAIYRPFEYEKKQKDKLTEKENFQFIQQSNLFDFMRRLLVKRFESSFGSFERSIKNFKNITEHVIEFINKTDKFILDRPLLEKIYDLDEEEIEKKLEEFSEKLLNNDYPKNNHIYNVKKFVYKEKFKKDIESDLALFKKITKELKELKLTENDPKVNCLIKNIKKELSKKPEKGEPKRKIVIFSEYLDTIKYLKPILEKEFQNSVLTVDGPLSTKKNIEIIKNFDASAKEQEDKYDILLTSDKISEGYNLNRAGMIINYDIPWNPVRVIQRVGRINRISKKVFNKLYLINFFPTEKGSSVVKSREIAQQKMFLIHNTLGEDAKIFDASEKPTAADLFERLQQNPEKQETESFYNKILREFIKIKKEFPELIKEIEKFPPRIKVGKKSKENELLTFIKKGRLYIRQMVYNTEGNKIYNPSLEEIFDHIKCSPKEKSLKLSSSFWENYEKIKKYKEQSHLPVSEKTLEERALTNLKSLIAHPWEEVMPHLNFIRTLREDIIDYGTLSDYTLRRIANLSFAKKDKKKTTQEIENLKKELGENYLEKEKEKEKKLSQEIIIAIENQKA